jgi:hypothetical protein
MVLKERHRRSAITQTRAGRNGMARETRARIATQKLLAMILYDTMREPAREARRSLGDQSDLVQAIGHLYDNVTAQVEKFVANDLLVREPFVGLGS